MTDSPKLDWRERATITVPEAADILGLCRNAAYDAVNRGEIPVVRFGNRRRVLVAPLIRMLEGQPAQANG